MVGGGKTRTFKERMKTLKKIRTSEILLALLPIAITAALVLVIYYFALPALTLRSASFVWLIVFACIIAALIYIPVLRKIERDGWWMWIVVAAVFLAALIMSVCSWTCFHAVQASEVADVTVSESSIDEVFPDLAQVENMNNLALVDLDTAKMLGDKKVAGLKNASWYEVDKEYNLIEYHGKYYRLSFLDYGGLFKFNKAKSEGIPGYVLVECTPEGGTVSQSATLVELDKPIRYSKGAFWSNDLRRHLRSQYPSYVFDTSFPEIDDNGVPYYVTGVLRPTCGVWGVKTVESFILTNAQTGESVEYTVDQAPEWIDHVFSLSYLTTIAEWHYAYRDGWWNAHFGKTGVWHTSYYYRSTRSSSDDDKKVANFYGYSSVVADGDVRFYTGLTAANAAESNLGWLLMDTSTGKMSEYAVVGAEESSAQAAVEQLVSAYRYQATFPLPANIAGEPSYIMCLKGAAGLVQAYAICNVENYSLAVQAETLPEAINFYLVKLGYAVETEAPTRDEVAEGPIGNSDVVNVYTVEVNGTIQYYYEMADGSLYVVVKVK